MTNKNVFEHPTAISERPAAVPCATGDTIGAHPDQQL